jgi:hypothetical protein
MEMNALAANALGPLAPCWGELEREVTPELRAHGLTPSLTQRQSGLPDLRKLKMRNRGRPRLRGEGNAAVFVAATFAHAGMTGAAR